MGVQDILGPALLGTGPALVTWAVLVFRRPLLVLTSLASAFYWLSTLLLVGAIVRPFAPLSNTLLPQACVLALGIAVQEAARRPLARAHTTLVDAVRVHCRRASAAAPSRPVALEASGERALALSHGLSHAIVHATFFSLAWTPYAGADGTLYVAACPRASFFTANAALALAFSLVLPAADLLALSGCSGGAWNPLPVAMHAGAAALTLINMAPGGCTLALPLLGLWGLGCVLVATLPTRLSDSTARL